ACGEQLGQGGVSPGVGLHQLPLGQRHPLVLGKIHDLPGGEDRVAAGDDVLAARQFLHRVDQQLAAFGVELQLGLVDPDELDAADVAARVGLDAVDDHAGVQCQPDLARLD